VIIISRADAASAGLKRYFTGKPCKHGHIAERAVGNRGCATCGAAQSKRYREQNIEYHRAIARDYYRDNTESMKRYHIRWSRENAAKANQHAMNRHAAKLRRTPGWLTEDDLWVMNEIYDLAKLRAKTTGVKHQVDHIIPLRGELVSGLHTPWNMQVITAEENARKNNQYEVSV